MRSSVTCFVALVVCLCSTSVHAQTHPCDQPAPANQTIASGSPHKAQFCAKQSDLIEAVVGYVDGAPFDLLPVTAKTGPSATGLILYEAPPFIQVARGNHILEVAAYNRNQFTGQLQLGGKSSPFPFVGADETVPPVAPAIKGIVK